MTIHISIQQRQDLITAELGKLGIASDIAVAERFFALFNPSALASGFSLRSSE